MWGQDIDRRPRARQAAAAHVALVDAVDAVLARGTTGDLERLRAARERVRATEL